MTEYTIHNLKLIQLKKKNPYARMYLHYINTNEHNTLTIFYQRKKKGAGEKNKEGKRNNKNYKISLT